jgi:hypothetical protein
VSIVSPETHGDGHTVHNIMVANHAMYKLNEASLIYVYKS